MFLQPWFAHQLCAKNRTAWAYTLAIGTTILRFVISAMGLIVVIVTFATWLNPNPLGPTSPRRLSEKDSGTTISLQAHNPLNIVLDGYTTQGHGWEAFPANDAIVSISQPSYTREWSGGGHTWFTVMADKPGRSHITFINDHVPSERPVKSFSIEVLVR